MLLNVGLEDYKNKKRSWPISRVLSWTVIHLGAQLLMRSSSLPGSDASHVMTTLFGFAPDGGYRVSRPPCGLLVSVALFLASRRTAVSRHPALRSPDFPPPITRRRLSSQLHLHFSTRTQMSTQCPSKQGKSISRSSNEQL